MSIFQNKKEKRKIKKYTNSAFLARKSTVFFPIDIILFLI